MRETLPGDLRRRTEAKIAERVAFGLALAVVVAIGVAVEWWTGQPAEASSQKSDAPGAESASGSHEGRPSVPEDADAGRR